VHTIHTPAVHINSAVTATNTITTTFFSAEVFLSLVVSLLGFTSAFPCNSKLSFKRHYQLCEIAIVQLNRESFTLELCYYFPILSCVDLDTFELLTESSVKSTQRKAAIVTN
jgi:hypothetical protein